MKCSVQILLWFALPCGIYLSSLTIAFLSLILFAALSLHIFFMLLCHSIVYFSLLRWPDFLREWVKDIVHLQFNILIRLVVSRKRSLFCNIIVVVAAAVVFLCVVLNSANFNNFNDFDCKNVYVVVRMKIIVLNKFLVSSNENGWKIRIYPGFERNKLK